MDTCYLIKHTHNGGNKTKPKGKKSQIQTTENVCTVKQCQLDYDWNCTRKGFGRVPGAGADHVCMLAVHPTVDG